jgi:hypothetical protein
MGPCRAGRARHGRPTQARLRPDAWRPVHRHGVAASASSPSAGAQGIVAVATRQVQPWAGTRAVPSQRTKLGSVLRRDVDALAEIADRVVGAGSFRWLRLPGPASGGESHGRGSFGYCRRSALEQAKQAARAAETAKSNAVAPPRLLSSWASVVGNGPEVRSIVMRTSQVYTYSRPIEHSMVRTVFPKPIGSRPEIGRRLTRAPRRGVGSRHGGPVDAQPSLPETATRQPHLSWRPGRGTSRPARRGARTL